MTTQIKKKGESLEKCAGCKSYFVERGTLCNNCTKKAEKKAAEDGE